VTFNESLHPRGRGEHGGEWIKKVDAKISADMGEKQQRPRVILKPKISQIEVGDKIRVKGWSKSIPVTGKSGDSAITPNGSVPVAKIDKVFPHNGGDSPKPTAVAKAIPKAPAPPKLEPSVPKAPQKPSGQMTVADVGNGKHPHNIPNPDSRPNAPGIQQLGDVMDYQTSIAPNVARHVSVGIRPANDEVFDRSSNASATKVLGVNVHDRGRFGSQQHEIHISEDVADLPSSYMTQQKKSGWFSKSNANTTMEHVASHEFGHSVQVKAGLGPTGDAVDALAKILGVTPPKRDITGTPDYRNMNEWTVKNRVAISKEVSIYGATDVQELMAEIWAEYSQGTSAKPPRRAAKAAGAILHAAVNGA
jgi:hypothetical protein